MTTSTPAPTSLDERLIELIQSYPELLEISSDAPTGYTHMGAILTDAVFQAGLRYQTVVWPRVEKILKIAEASTTSGLLNLLRTENPLTLLNWKSPEKPTRLLLLTEFFLDEGVETAEDLQVWLLDEKNIDKLKQQRGVGNKTADYIKILVGIPAFALDRHIFSFLASAGIQTNNYHEAQRYLQRASEHFQVPHNVLDHNIWVLMSSGRFQK